MRHPEARIRASTAPNRNAGLSAGIGMVSLVVSCTMLSGCYQRVVGVRGMGGYGVAVQEPYRSETALDRAVDRWVGGEPEEKPRTRAAVPLPEKKRRESSSW